MEKKALFLDMDGTTLDDEKQISPENREALRKTIEAGHEVVITTGRPTPSARYLLTTHRLDELGCRYVIAYNGGMVVDCVSGEVLFSRTIPLEWMKTLNEHARKTGVYLQSYDGDYVLAEREDENLLHYTNKTSMKWRVVPDLSEALKNEPCKALAVDIKEHEPLEQFRQSLAEWAEDKMEMYFSCREYLEIVPKGITKGNALKAFCERMGIPLENAVSAGDEGNDMSMIQIAGTGCAVANAQEEVREAADYVTERDNNHSAIAEIVDKFILN